MKNMSVPLKNMGVPLENMGVPLKKFVKIKAPPQNNSIVFDSTPKKIISFYKIPLENSMFPQLSGGRGGDRGINCIIIIIIFISKHGKYIGY